MTCDREVYFKTPNFLKATSWGYGPEDGPDAWHNNFPVAKAGKRQSPVDIKTSKIIDRFYVTLSKPLNCNYQNDHCLNVENTGASWKVDETTFYLFSVKLTSYF